MVHHIVDMSWYQCCETENVASSILYHLGGGKKGTLNMRRKRLVGTTAV
jgi:hypothetical protein